jgi:hypothetical protein
MMKAREWRDFLEVERTLHRKTLFTLTELVNAAGVTREVLNVELSRLRRQGVIVRYAQGLYGSPGAVSAEELLEAIDSHAYMTGIHALHLHNLITQRPTAITCLTDRRSPRACVRSTPVGRFVFSCVRRRVYCPPSGRPVAGPEQALCDFVYLCRREGVPAAAQVTFQGLSRLSRERLRDIARRYPGTVQEEVERLLGVAARPSGSGTGSP